ncbi:MAG TPA: 3-deoxy-D-manno-octulosonate 8-phosphate phosphatase [Sedimenticola sp.]|nr:3-deoxy-D-manno-octulosonate 8-phosphate phosphatase [Sedimenticola sp.]
MERLVPGIRLVVFDFDGVFTDNMVYVLQDGSEAVRCSRLDGLGLEKLRRLGVEYTILSTETNPVVSARAAKLKTDCIQGCGDKPAALAALARERGIPLSAVAFVGNDINDLECLRRVGLPIVVRDAHPDVLPLARYRTLRKGGEGAVREVCDLFEQILIGKDGFNPQDHAI